MDQETLDRLLIDRELGALAPDAAVLLDAYLERDAQAAKRAREFGEAGDLARQALEADEPAVIPDFPRRVLSQKYVSRRRWRVVGQGAALAACLGFGIWLGGTGSGRELGMSGGGQTPVVISVSRSEPPETSGDDTRFWSARRLYRNAAESKPNPAKRFIWESPVSKPKRGGAA
jgi:hypothetical protein